MSESTTADPTPEARARVPNPQGVPVVLGDGRTWILAHGCLEPALLAQTDLIFDDLIMTGKVPMGPVVLAGWMLLLANYSLADDELTALLSNAADADLANAVVESLLGPNAPRRTWSTWALSSFFSNDIDPAKVPPYLRPEVLYQLVHTGRAMGQSDYIDSANASVSRARLLSMLPAPRPATPKP